MAIGIIRIINRKKLLALIIKADYKKEGIDFLVPSKYPQQLAYMKRPRGYTIISHLHSPVLRKIKFTQEVLFIKSGKVRIDFYDKKRHYVESRVVKQGDIIFLAFGGHGFEFLEESEMIEVKQGPFLENAQPVRFEAVAKNRIKLKK